MDLKHDLLDALRDVHIAMLRRLQDEDKPSYAEATALKQEEVNIATLIQHYKRDDWKKSLEKVAEQEEKITKGAEDDSDEDTVPR